MPQGFGKFRYVFEYKSRVPLQAQTFVLCLKPALN